ncbi:uncharacterized protein LOC110011712 [Sesamum indicum]|uniref:Uncharacterized protein LOC110011712 n=1 Tax=Sesamum indicum TaxID=4182 RepID=A0A8M8UVX8_SESIN|nr:uncharacterized protein LOC110011712 [Sesamum indicum]
MLLSDEEARDYDKAEQDEQTTEGEETEGDIIIHLKKVLELLRKHQLYGKTSKCSLAQMKVEYLGHIISWEGVATDPQKVEWMLNRTNVKALRGFLGLTGYYRKFIKVYVAISEPLILLLKKDVFEWKHRPSRLLINLKR